MLIGELWPRFLLKFDFLNISIHKYETWQYIFDFLNYYVYENKPRQYRYVSVPSKLMLFSQSRN